MKRTTLRFRIIVHLFLVALAIFALFPFSWMVVTSIKNRADIYKSPPVWIPHKVTLQHFSSLTRWTFARYFLNSVGIATVVMLAVMILSFLSAYGLSRFTFRFKNLLMSSSLVGQLIPVSVMFIPFFLVFARLGLVNTYSSLIIVHIIMILPFGIWIMTGYLNSIPKSLDEAAIIDGCSFIKVLTRVIFPVSLPGVVTVAFYSFMDSFQEFLFANILLSSVAKKTLPIALVAFQGQYQINFGGMMAASVAATLPTTIVFVLFQKRLIPGLTGGALKG